MTYSKKVIENFLNPKNMGEIKNPDGIGKIGNPVCGDIMWIYIKVGKRKIKGKEKKYIKDIKFKTFGCIAAIATSSVVTQITKGKTLEDAKKITKEKIIKKLEGMPPVKIHCSVLGIQALKKAIENYEKKYEQQIYK
jgi:nitrogen fixation protein NifU and related proteins